MKLAHSISFAFVLGLISQVAWSAEDAQHRAHHAEGVTSVPAAKAAPTKPRGGMTGMDAQMKSMGVMHDRLMAARTPEERNALMPEHMKAMQAGMAMMDGPSSREMRSGKGAMASHHQAMEKRMEMMQATMQLMMDRLPAVTAN